MNGQRHLVIGLACGMAVAGGLSWDKAPVIAVCGAGALLPDLDSEYSVGSRFAQVGLAVGSGIVMLSMVSRDSSYPMIVGGILLWMAANIIVRQYLMPYRWLRHRGPLHSIFVGLVLAGALYWFTGNQLVSIGLGVGWLSHLLADAGTRAGEPLLWPIPGPRHTHWRKDETVKPVWEARTCSMWHLTPKRFRWRSGNGMIEWPLSLLVVGLTLANLFSHTT